MDAAEDEIEQITQLYGSFSPGVADEHNHTLISPLRSPSHDPDAFVNTYRPRYAPQVPPRPSLTPVEEETLLMPPNPRLPTPTEPFIPFTSLFTHPERNGYGAADNTFAALAGAEDPFSPDRYRKDGTQGNQVGYDPLSHRPRDLTPQVVAPAPQIVAPQPQSGATLDQILEMLRAQNVSRTGRAPRSHSVVSSSRASSRVESRASSRSRTPAHHSSRTDSASRASSRSRTPTRRSPRADSASRASSRSRTPTRHSTSAPAAPQTAHMSPEALYEILHRQYGQNQTTAHRVSPPSSPAARTPTAYAHASALPRGTDRVTNPSQYHAVSIGREEMLFLPPRPDKIQATKLELHNAKHIPELSRAAGNWLTWSERIVSFVHSHMMVGFIEGWLTMPNPAENYDGATEWIKANNVILALIREKCTSDERDHIAPAKTAFEAFHMLKGRHEELGPIYMVRLYQRFFDTHFSRAERFETTTKCLRDMSHQIFAMGPPSEDQLFSIGLMHALGREYPTIRNEVATQMNSARHGGHFDSNSVLQRLDVEQAAIDLDGGAVAMATMTGKYAGPTGCGNCKKPHLTENCWAPGGKMAGRREEVLEALRKARGGQSSSTNAPAQSFKPPVAKPTTNVETRHYVPVDMNGQSVLLDSTTGKIYTTTPMVAAATEEAQPEFAGLATDTLTHAQIRDIDGDANLEEYQTFFLSTTPLRTNLNWRSCLRANVLSAISTTPLQQSRPTVVNPDKVPFYLDSGASTHVTSCIKDFYTFSPVDPRPIHGVNGSSIFALGIGTVRLSTGTPVADD
ncbi:hypothetical protein CONPUDRAFT_151505 [Coniophora puteana RWD-64-598 SS2]|uniref:Retrovirus-related Pol polyprotein from transposon TNT 1-94-like beta-barrel domain-containing protein n=1 Tax=Coniophora puteana (strain RWD-64-598) TaxID=741705 RepID=A0A5M3MZR5_CONPW|nr:uncharacterized protein CONPUDRAFT_151505 [Coniophora puteana RWD-64-598 SS2]EIW84487.1 hypothetical protein CONPUDRAFT_151505 [Coniophora puteana RWD-64-598 SS2]